MLHFPSIVIFALAVIGASTQFVYPNPHGQYGPIARPNYPSNGQYRPPRIVCLPHGYDLPKSHSAFYGCRNATDRLVFQQSISKPGRFFSARKKLIEYPGELPIGHVRNETISAIWCYDLVGYGKGGFCAIESGGIGRSFVRLNIYHTERNTPLRFQVEIYGRNNSTRH